MQVTQAMGLGGLERVVLTLCRTLDPARFEVSILCLREAGMMADAARDAGIRVLQLEPSGGERPDYFAFRRVARLLRRERVDVVHTHNTNAFVDGGLGARLAGVRTIVHTDHARDFPDRLRYMVAEHAMSHLVYRVVGVSDHTTRNLHRYEWIPRRKLRTIPNGIVAESPPPPADRGAARAALGIPRRGPLLGLGVRLTEQKGIGFLLEALPRVLEQVPDLQLAIAGDGPLEEPLRARVRELGLEHCVHFLGTRSDMPAILPLFDLYVLPSLWEGLPMVILEAMAAGLPVVATAVGGVPSAVEHDVTGVLVPPRDPRALSDALLHLLCDAPLRARFGAAARRAFEDRFSAHTMAREYERLYLRR